MRGAAELVAYIMVTAHAVDEQRCTTQKRRAAEAHSLLDRFILFME